MTSKAKIIIAREKVPDAELQSVKQIPSDQVCVVYIGGNGTVNRRRDNGKMSSARENANSNAKYVRMEITEPVFADEFGIDIPIYSVGYNFDDMDQSGINALRTDNKKVTINTALQTSQNTDGYNHYVIIDTRNLRRTFKHIIMPYLAQDGHKIDVAEVAYRSRFLKIIIDGDEKTEFNFRKQLYDTLLDLKYSDSEIDTITNTIDKLIRQRHTEHIDSLFHSIILPRISKNGKRLDLNDAMRAIRKVTFVAHCYGAFVAKKLQEKAKTEMAKLGYSSREITMILNQMLVVAHAPSCRLDNQTNGFISFMSAFDNTALVPLNWLSKYIKDNVTDDSKFMVHNSLKYKNHTWFPRNLDQPIAFLPKKYGNMVIVPQSFDFVIDEGMIGVDEHEHTNTAYNSKHQGETTAGYILNQFAKNVIINGIKNSLMQQDKFVPLPNVYELLFVNDNSENRQKFDKMQKNGLDLVRSAYKSATKTIHDKMSQPAQTTIRKR